MQEAGLKTGAPQPTVATNTTAQRAQPRFRGRWQVLLIALIFIAPVAASYFTYYVLRPGGRTNFGTLIDPQRPIPEVIATRLDGQPVKLQDLKGQWLLISVSGGACDVACRDNLYLQRQLRAAQGQNQRRMDWVWLIDDEAAVPVALLPGLEEATVLRVPRAALADWLQAEPGHRLSEHLYVVDPIGHWMMRFPPDLDLSTAKKARRDLARLLYVSADWDAPGRREQ